MVPKLLEPAASAATGSEVSATVDIFELGLATLLAMIGGNTGNDSIYHGDQLTEFGAFVGGGAGNDLGTFNSGASTAGKLNTNFSGATVAGGNGNDTVFVHSLVIPLQLESLVTPNDSVMLSAASAKSKLV